MDTEYTKGFKAGLAWEHERIIKLLEDYDFSTIWRQIEWSPPAWESFGPEEVIELIKGENK
jgi:hypothetical protein